MTTTWRDLVLDQLTFYWDAHLWPRLHGLTDVEYLWEPVAGAWSLRPGEGGVVRIEMTVPEPPVPPVTTIAWRMAHVGRDVLGKRARAFFGVPATIPAPPEDALMYDDAYWPEPLPLDAAGGLALLAEGFRLWRDGIASLDDDALLRPLGPKGGPFADDSMAALALHLNRETMAHGAEMNLLRDLYRAQVTHGDPVSVAAFAGRADDLADRLAGRGDGAALAARHPGLLAQVAALRHWDVVRVLVAAGVPVTEPTDTGATALHYAAGAGAGPVVDLLLEAGADPTATDDGFRATPQGWAEHLGQADVAERLRRVVEGG